MLQQTYIDEAVAVHVLTCSAVPSAMYVLHQLAPVTVVAAVPLLASQHKYCPLALSTKTMTMACWN